MRLLLLLFLVSGLSIQSFAKTIYVGKTGSPASDSNSCTLAQDSNTPKLNISGASGGISCLASGDTLIIKAGTYTDVIGQASIPAGSSWASPTTLRANTGDVVTLTGGGASIGHYNSNQSYIVWDGFVFNISQGIIIGNGSHHIRFTNFEVKNSVDNGCLIEAGSDSNEFINGSVHDTGSNPAGPPHSFYVGSANNLFDNVDVYNSLNGYGYHLYNGGTNTVNNNIIRNSEAHNCSRSGILVSDGVNNQIYNNFVYNNNEHGIQLWHNVDNAKIFNNTVTGNGSVGGGYGIYVTFADTDGVQIRNNISYNNVTGTILSDGTGTISSNNLCNSTSTHCQVSGNPNLVSSTNLHLQATSTAAIDKGATLTEFSTDIDGNTRPQGLAWDIGADEYASGSTPTITVNSPNGGSWTIGSPQTITWGAVSVGANVEIALDRGNDGTFEQTIVASTPTSAGSYSWTVDGAANNNCKIRVKDTAAATNGVSNLFAISASSGGALTKIISDNTTGSFIGEITGTEDAELFLGQPTLNQANETAFYVSKFSASDNSHSLLKFTGLSQIPSTATVTSVTLGIYLTDAQGATSQTIDVRRLLRNWNESQATWNIYSTGNNWTTAGGLGAATDRVSAASAQINLPSATAAYYTVTSNSGTGTLFDDVQKIVNGTYSNFGWHLERNGTGNDSEYRGFTSSEGNNGQRPYLSVSYTTVTSTITVTQPTNGDLFLVGDTGPIRWTSQGISGPVNVDLSRDGGTTWERIISGVDYASADQVYIYTAPVSSNCKVRVVSVNDPTVVGTSTGTFRIGGTRAGFKLN